MSVLSSEVRVNRINSSYMGDAIISTIPGQGYPDGGTILSKELCSKGNRHGRYFGEKINIIKDMETKCKKCEKNFKIRTVAFSGCSYKISGKDIFGNDFSDEGIVSDDKWKYFDISEAKCENIIIYATITMKDIRFPDIQKFSIQTIWTARQFVEFYQRKIENFTPLMLMINGKTVLLNERICDIIDNNKYYDIEFSCIPIGYVEDD